MPLSALSKIAKQPPSTKPQSALASIATGNSNKLNTDSSAPEGNVVVSQTKVTNHSPSKPSKLAAVSKLSEIKKADDEPLKNNSLLSVAKEIKPTAPRPRSLLEVSRAEKPSSLVSIATEKREKDVLNRKPNLAQVAQDFKDSTTDKMSIGDMLTESSKEQATENRRKTQSVLQSAVDEIKEDHSSVKKSKKKSVENILQEAARDVHEENNDEYRQKITRVESENESEVYSSDSTLNSGNGGRDQSSDKYSEESPETDEVTQNTPCDSKSSKELMQAVYRNDLRNVRKLIEEEELDIETADQHGWSGLHWAAARGNVDIMEFFLRKGVQVNAVELTNGWSPLHVAVVRGHLEAVKLLIEKGSNVSLLDNHKDTPIDCAQSIRDKKGKKILKMLSENIQN